MLRTGLRAGRIHSSDSSLRQGGQVKRGAACQGCDGRHVTKDSGLSGNQ